jgi:hypothetical protein
LRYKNQVLKKINFFNEISTHYLKILSRHSSYKANTFFLKFKDLEISAQDRIWKTMFLKFDHNGLADSEVSHYGFLRGHSSISQLKDRMVQFKKRIQQI